MRLEAENIAVSIAGKSIVKQVTLDVPEHKFSALLGATATLASDTLGRIVVYPGEVGVGAMTSIIGAPFFVWLVRRGKVLGL